MAKTITREVTIYRYKFARVDAATMAITDVVEIESPKELGVRDLGKKGKELDDRICVHTDKITRKYELPLDRFIAACNQYAEDAANTTEESTDN